MTSRLDTATAYLAHLLLRDTRPNAHAKAKEPNAIAQLQEFSISMYDKFSCSEAK
jgi:hypothetical protein